MKVRFGVKLVMVRWYFGMESKTILKKDLEGTRSLKMLQKADDLGSIQTILVDSGRSWSKVNDLDRKWTILTQSGWSWPKVNDFDRKWTTWVENTQAWAPDFARTSIEKLKPRVEYAIWAIFCGNIRLYFLTPLEIVFLWSFESLSVLCDVFLFVKFVYIEKRKCLRRWTGLPSWSIWWRPRVHDLPILAFSSSVNSRPLVQHCFWSHAGCQFLIQYWLPLLYFCHLFIHPTDNYRFTTPQIPIKPINTIQKPIKAVAGYHLHRET